MKNGSYRNLTSEIFCRQLSDDKRKSHGFRPLRGYMLSSLVSSGSCLRKIFLGFSIDGNYIFSYSFKMTCNVTDIAVSSVYKYKLQVWKFNPNEKLKKCCSIPLFSGAAIRSELFLELAQFPCDQSRLLVLGHEAEKFVDSLSPTNSQCWSSSVSYLSIVPLTLNRYSNHPCEIDNKLCSFVLNYSVICTVSHFTPLFYYFTTLESPVCILNSGTHLYVIDLNDRLFDAGQDNTKNKYLLDSSIICSTCKRSVPDYSTTVSSVLDVELLIQGLCEQSCKVLGLTYVGFSDYEACILDMKTQSELDILFSVLIELSDDTNPFWEMSFVVTIRLCQKNDCNDQCFGGHVVEFFHSPMKPRLNTQCWGRQNEIRRELGAMMVPTTSFSTARLLTNRAVLRRQSLPCLFDMERINAIIL